MHHHHEQFVSRQDHHHYYAAAAAAAASSTTAAAVAVAAPLGSGQVRQRGATLKVKELAEAAERTLQRTRKQSDSRITQLRLLRKPALKRLLGRSSGYQVSGLTICDHESMVMAAVELGFADDMKNVEFWVKQNGKGRSDAQQRGVERRKERAQHTKEYKAYKEQSLIKWTTTRANHLDQLNTYLQSGGVTLPLVIRLAIRYVSHYQQAHSGPGHEWEEAIVQSLPVMGQVVQFNDQTIMVRIASCEGDHDFGGAARADVRRAYFPTQIIAFHRNFQQSPKIIRYTGSTRHGKYTSEAVLDYSPFEVCQVAHALTLDQDSVSIAVDETALWTHIRREGLSRELNSANLMRTVQEKHLRDVILDMVGDDVQNVSEHQRMASVKAAASSKKRKKSAAQKLNNNNNASASQKRKRSRKASRTRVPVVSLNTAAAAAAAPPTKIKNHHQASETETEYEDDEDIPVLKLLTRSVSKSRKR